MLTGIEWKEEINLNGKQRIVLIIGAAAFVYVILTAPKISIINGTYVVPPANRKDIAKVVDIRTAITRAIAVLGATLLVSIALKDKERTPIQSFLERNSLADGGREEGEIILRKNAVAKIVGFLKDFF